MSLLLGTDHLTLSGGGREGAGRRQGLGGGVEAFFFFFSSRFSFYFLPIENQRICCFFHSLRAKIYFSGQSKNKIFFSKAYMFKMYSFRFIRSCIS